MVALLELEGIIFYESQVRLGSSEDSESTR